MNANDIGRMSPLSLYSEALALKLGNEISPRMAIVHVTNRCNHKCTGCEYANTHTQKPAQMESERLLRLVEEIADLGVASVLFSGGGEPTRHPDFATAIRHAKQRNLMIGIFSNGTPITRSLAACIVENASFIRVSVDAATAQTYATIRQVKPSEFAKCKKAISFLLEAKNRLQSEIEIGLKFLVRPCNIQEIVPFVSLAKELAVDNVQFKLLRNEPDEPTHDQINQAQNFIDQAKQTYPEIKIRGKLASSEIKVTTHCWLSPLRVVVSAEGDVHLCNYFNFRRQTHTYGNINKAPLAKIWFGDQHHQALREINPTECTRYDCRFHTLNTELLELVLQQRQRLDFI